MTEPQPICAADHTEILTRLLKNRETARLPEFLERPALDDAYAAEFWVHNVLSALAAANDFETLNYAFVELPKAGIFLLPDSLPSSCAQLSSDCTTATRVRFQQIHSDSYNLEVSDLAAASPDVVRYLQSMDFQYAELLNQNVMTAKTDQLLSLNFFAHVSQRFWSEASKDAPNFENLVKTCVDDFCRNRQKFSPVSFSGSAQLLPFLPIRAYDFQSTDLDLRSAALDPELSVILSRTCNLVSRHLLPQLLEFLERQVTPLQPPSTSLQLKSSEVARLFNSCLQAACFVSDEASLQTLVKWLQTRQLSQLLDVSIIYDMLSKDSELLRLVISHLQAEACHDLAEPLLVALRCPEDRQRCLQNAAQLAVRKGNFDTVKQLLSMLDVEAWPNQQTSKYFAESLFNLAVQYSRIDMLQWLSETLKTTLVIASYLETALEYSSSLGSLGVVKWLIEDSEQPETALPAFDELIVEAKKNGHQPTAEYLELSKTAIAAVGLTGFRIAVKADQLETVMRAVKLQKSSQTSSRC